MCHDSRLPPQTQKSNNTLLNLKEFKRKNAGKSIDVTRKKMKRSTKGKNNKLKKK
jgi:hypothetical protein